MRILMVTQFYAPVVGGEERLVESLAVELTARGHDVAVVALAHPGQPELETRDGVRVHRIRSTAMRLSSLFVDAARPHSPPAPDPEAAAGLLRVFAVERPEVVHAHNWLLHSLLPAKALRRFPLVVSLHDYSLVCATKRLMRLGRMPCAGPAPVRCLVCAAARHGIVKGIATAALAYPAGRVARVLADIVVPVSDSVADRVGLTGGMTPYVVIPNFVPDELHVASQLPLELRQAGDGYLLLVGDLSHDKGVDTLLDAHARLARERPLVLIGRPLSHRLDRLPPRVLQIDPLPHDAVLAAVRACSVAVVPSIVPESFGLTALEAMALGKPVVAAASGALPQLVENRVTGLLFPPGDADALRRSLDALLVDPDLRRRLGEGAHSRAQAYTARNVVPRFEQAYEFAMARAAGRRRGRVQERAA